MPQVVIVSALGPQGQVGPQGPSGSFDNISGSFLYTSSFNAFTASYNQFTASYNTGSFTGSFTGVSDLTSLSASSALVTGNVTVLGTASINTLIVNQTQLSTGSNQLGDAADDTQTLYGSVIIPTGSLAVSGNASITGSISIGTTAQNVIALSAGYGSSPNLTVGTTTIYTTYQIASGNTDHVFYTRGTSGTTVERLRIKGSAAVTDLQVTSSNFIVQNNALYVSASGLVGIGTSTPFSSLHIQKTTGSLEPLLLLDVNSLTTGSGAILRFNTSPGDKSIGSDIVGIRSGTAASSSLYFSTYPGSGTTNVERMRITSDGNVGIGTSTPTYKLDVNGAVRLQTNAYINVAATTNSGLDLINNATSSVFAKFGYIGGGSNDSFIGSITNNNFSIRSFNTDRITITNTGNVGIRTTTPTQTLDVSGSIALNGNIIQNQANLDLKLSGLLDGRALRFIASSAGARIQALGSTASNLSLGTTVGGSEVTRLTILENGDIGIGTTNPTSKLHVSGTIKIESTAAEKHLEFTRVGNNYISTANGGALLINVVGTAVENNSLFRVYPSAVMVGNGIPLTTATFNVKGSGTTSSTTALLVQNANVSSSLAVDDSGTVYVGSANSFNGTLRIERASASTGLTIRGLDGNFIGGGSWPVYEPYNYGNATHNWNIGHPSIGSYNWYAGTNATLTSNTFLMRLTRSGSLLIGTTTESAKLYISGSSGSALLKVDSDVSSSILFVTGSGNVGIGTSTPTQKLDVDGAVLVRAGNAVYFRDTISYIGEGLGLNIVSGATRNIRLNAGGSDRMFVSASGNVGIGTSTPTSTLDIQSTTTGSIRISGSAGSQITLVRPTAGLTGYVRYLGTSMEIGTAGSDGLNLNTLNTARLSIQTNGDVGIGSTPNARLHARGSGTTSATNTFRLENSSALPSLIVTDDLNSTFFGNVGIGAAAASGSLHISASASTSSAAVYIYKSGSTTLDIQGSQGQLFSVTDQLSGSLMSVNDISGLPILEVFSDDRVVMGSFASPALIVTGSAVRFPATGSAAPTYSGSEGQTLFTVIGGNAFMYVWLGGRWRSGSLA